MHAMQQTRMQRTVKYLHLLQVHVASECCIDRNERDIVVQQLCFLVNTGPLLSNVAAGAVVKMDSLKDSVGWLHNTPKPSRLQV